MVVIDHDLEGPQFEKDMLDDLDNEKGLIHLLHHESVCVCGTGLPKMESERCFMGFERFASCM